MTIAKLNDQDSNEIVGGRGLLSIGTHCTVHAGCFIDGKVTKGIWCTNRGCP